jgi:hypothetical protein
VRDEILDPEHRHHDPFDLRLHAPVPRTLERQARHTGQDVDSVGWKPELRDDVGTREVLAIDVEVLQWRSECSEGAPHPVRIVGVRLDPEPYCSPSVESRTGIVARV